MAFILLLMLGTALFQSTWSQCGDCLLYNEYQTDCSVLYMPEVPTCIPNTTVWLNLIYNNLTTLTPEYFQNLPNLQDLLVDSNQLETIAPDTFRNNPKLKTVSLSFNKLTTLPADLFVGTLELTQVWVDFNEIVDIPGNIFRNNLNLEYISLSVNKISVISETLFSNLTSLTDIMLSSNNLASFQKEKYGVKAGELLARPHNQNTIDISKLNLQDATNLRFISLDGNAISDLGNNTFQFNTKLNNIDLSDNQLTSISPSVISTNHDMLLFITGNPWHCDCETVAFLDACDARRTILAQDPTCASPPELAGVMFSSLRNNLTCTRLQCFPESFVI